MFNAVKTTFLFCLLFVPERMLVKWFYCWVKECGSNIVKIDESKVYTTRKNCKKSMEKNDAKKDFMLILHSVLCQ